MPNTISDVLRYLRRHCQVEAARDLADGELLERFLACREDSAFTILVQRHGPMVLNVCKRVLGDAHAAEDAFQATFLVLVRKAASIRSRGALAGWLYGVAQRVALRAGTRAAAQRSRERLAPARSLSGCLDELNWQELRAILDEEIAALPERYRAPIVLCHLEGQSYEQAGRALGWPKTTLARRLTRARDVLRERLVRRGITLSAAVMATALDEGAAGAALPTLLLLNTVKAAALFAAGKAAAAGALSAQAVALAEESMKGLLAFKAKALAVLLFAAVVAGGLGLAGNRSAGDKALEAPRATPGLKAAPQPREEKKPGAEIRGTVLDPDGKPVRGAKLVFTYGWGKKIPHKLWAVSATDGRFAFTVPLKEVDDGYTEKPWENTVVVAAAAGYGFATAQVGIPGAADLTLRLVKDDVPIRGRIIDLQGKAVAGVRIHIANNMLGIPNKGDLTDFVAALKAGKDDKGSVHRWNYFAWLYSPAFDLLFPPVTTGADGRFVVKGIGRERMVELRIEGPTIATEEVTLMTRHIDTIQLPLLPDQPKNTMVTYHGADCEFLAVPSRPVVGVVRDKDTGKPLAGAIVEGDTRVGHGRSGFLQTTTDKDGRYRLDGLPKADGNQILVRTNDNVPPLEIEMSNQQPYISLPKKVGNPPGLEPVTVDFPLKRGIWVKGRVTDKATGKPLLANVEYYCFDDNPNAKELRHIGGFNVHLRASRENGAYQIAVLPGPGLIAVRAYQDRYPMGVGADKIKGRRDEIARDVFITAPYFCCGGDFHWLVEIDPKPGTESIRCDVALNPGRTLKGTVLDTEGKPLAGARIAGLKDMGFWEDNTGSQFTVEGVQPNKPRALQFVHEGRKLSGYLILPGDEKDPVRVQLKPYGTLTGRIVTPLGKPLTSVRVNCRAQIQHQGQPVYAAELIVYPGKDGRFRIEGLFAGLKHELSVSRSNLQQTIAGGNPKDVTIAPGATKDLGDLQVKPVE